MDRDGKAEAESRRIIERTAAESDASMMRRARDHMTGGDADENDRIEVWGTRIGRWLGLVLLVYLIWWLFDFAMGAG